MKCTNLRNVSLIRCGLKKIENGWKNFIQQPTFLKIFQCVSSNRNSDKSEAGTERLELLSYAS